jgi:hypothetical protein
MERVRLTIFEGHSPAQALAFALLLAFVVVAPLPYGAVTAEGALKIELFAFAIAALSVIGKQSPLGAANLALAAIVGIALLGAFQLIPLDAALLARLSPVTARIYTETNELLRTAGARPAVPRLTLVPTATVRATLLVAAYAALFIAGFRLARTRVQRRVLCLLLILAAAGDVIYGASTRWIGEVTTGDAASVLQDQRPRLHGPFINANHFAGYLEIALALAFGFLWSEVLRSRDRASTEHDRSAAIEKRLLPITWRLLLLSIVAAGIGLTQSRMGIAASALTLGMLVVAAALHRTAAKRRRFYLTTVSIFLAAAGLLIIVSTRDVPLLRFLATDPHDPEIDSRIRAWGVSVEAWKRFPHFGSGLGTFREAFRRVQPPDLPGIWEQAHSDSLQLLVTGGWIALALAALGLGTLFVIVARGWWNQRHREESALGLAALGALFSLAVHGIAEFNFSMPAIPATLAVILAVGWSAVTDRAPRDEPGPVALS